MQVADVTVNLFNDFTSSSTLNEDVNIWSVFSFLFLVKLKGNTPCTECVMPGENDSTTP
ncbi:Hypothetical predicted protein, partial [Paramuricea clavata]